MAALETRSNRLTYFQYGILSDYRKIPVLSFAKRRNLLMTKGIVDLWFYSGNFTSYISKHNIYTQNALRETL